jgi:D-alanyl-D-alanine carboxypeptidase
VIRRARTIALVACAGVLAGCTQVAPVVPAATAVPPSAAPASTASALVGGPEPVAELAPPARPLDPANAARLRHALVADPCVDRDLPAPAAGDATLTILDRTYALPAAYVPDDLVAAAAAGLPGSSGTKLVRDVLVDDLAAMHDAWRAAGLAISVESGYRSHAAQAATLEAWVARLGSAEAVRRTARPGHSEHQLGTALDLSSPGWSGRFGDWATESVEGAWMAEHGWKYGFVMSYPAGGEAKTCFGYEPWHYRWVGRAVAAAQRTSGLTLREYLVRAADD